MHGWTNCFIAPVTPVSWYIIVTKTVGVKIKLLVPVSGILTQPLKHTQPCALAKGLCL